jgi:membrane protease YdiL (CAAX protease family)
MAIGSKPATGLQIAFLVYAVMLLAVPLSNAVVRAAELEGTLRALVEKGAHFLLACLLIFGIASLRRSAIRMLEVPIPRSKRIEVASVWLLDLVAAFGAIAALALWFWFQEGPARVDRMIADVDRQSAEAFSGPGLVRLALASTLGPLIEEIVFRGFIYRAFERQWGWVVSLVATSALFGLYHPHFWSAFTGSVILVCLLRRTGSLRAPIVVHMLFNLALWFPLLGQYLFPHGVALSDPSNWIFHGACLVFAGIAVPAYVYMSRNQRFPATLFLDPNGALQK